MLQIPQNTEFSDSIGNVSQSVSKMAVFAEQCMVVPKKIHITINDPLTVEAPKLITDGKDKDEEKPKATKSESVLALKAKEKTKRAEEKEKKWRNNVKKWQDGLLITLTKTLTDNPITNFIKDHWGKLLIGLGFLFLKPAQMKAVWEALKGMATWLWKNGPGIFKGIYDGLKWLVPKIGKLIGGIFKWLFGETDKERAQDKVDNMKRKDDESEVEFIDRKAAEQKKVDQMLDGGERTGGLDDSLFKRVALGLGSLILLLKKLGPDGIVGKMFSKMGKGLSLMGKGLFDKVIGNRVMEHKAKDFLTDDMMKMDRGKKLSMMDRFRNNDYVKYGKDKASKVGGVVKAGASKVGGAVKNVASAGGDWFKTLMGKFGKAGKFLAKMGKSVVRGLMTMGPYGWGILAGIALGGLVWYFWDDITKVWDKVASSIKEGFTAILTMASGIVGSARSMLGNFLRSIGAGMIADWIDPDGADPEKEKEEFTWGGFAKELWNIYSGIWGKIFDLIKAINPIAIAKKVGGKIWNTVKGIFGMDDDEVEPISDEQVKIQDDKIENRKSKGKYGTKAEFLQSEEYKSQIRKPDGTLKGINTNKQDKMWEAYLDGVDNKPSAVSTPSKVTATPIATRGTERAQKKIEEVRNIKSTKERKKKIKNILKGPDGEEFWEAMSPEEQDRHRGVAMLGGVITKEQALSMQPRVSPTMKADTLNQVQGENTELSSAGNTVVAPTTINNYYNSSGGGGEGGTAIYGVPTAQQGKQHRHSNIR